MLTFCNVQFGKRCFSWSRSAVAGSHITFTAMLRHVGGKAIGSKGVKQQFSRLWETKKARCTIWFGGI
jgi:hypothetical protein